jgi:hypothetical protein
MGEGQGHCHSEPSEESPIGHVDAADLKIKDVSLGLT